MNRGVPINRSRWYARLAIFTTILGGSALAAGAIIKNLALVRALHETQAEHVEQEELTDLVRNNQTEAAFDEAFEHGDELFETRFNAIDGVGANVGDGQRFTRVPRADLRGPGEWANHSPARETGPNAASCNGCHNLPGDDGAGGAVANVHRDPQHSAALGRFIQRNTPHLFGAGAIQRLAEEMTSALQALRDDVIAAACAGPVAARQTAMLDTKGVRFGRLVVTRVSSGSGAATRRTSARQRDRRRADRIRTRSSDGGTSSDCPGFIDRQFTLDNSEIVGVDTDLVVRPFQWKGSVAFVRDFNRGAAHNELGMQAVELVGANVDGDFDGVVDELTIGDQTSLAVYLSAQPRPVTRVELADLGLVPPLTSAELGAISAGESQFTNLGCDGCHRPSLTLHDALFSEPSQSADYRDSLFPGGQNPIELGVDPALPITFDLTRDIPENRVEVGGQIVALGNHIADGNGGATVFLYGDLRRHDLGPALAERIDEVGTGASTFLTENLWGVGSTAPYLHDGRATTLTEAILEHGGEAADSRAAFLALPQDAQLDLIAFLNNLVLFKQAQES